MKKIKYHIWALSMALTAASCGNADKAVEKSGSSLEITEVVLSDIQQNNAGIKTESIKERNLANEIKVTGKIDVPPQNMVSISAPLGGFLKSTKLLPGMKIRKGETIAVMEDQLYIQLQQEFLNSKYKLEYEEKEFQRQKELSESSAGSTKAFEMAKSNYLTTKTNVVALGERLKLLGINPNALNESNISSTIQIHSPINGYVSMVKVNVGKYIQASEVMFDLVNPEDIHLNMTVFEKDLEYIKIGQKVKAFTNSKPGNVYPCEIILIGQDVSSDRHVEVHCHFEKYDHSLIPGMYMNALIETDAAIVKSIPESAIVNYGAKNYLFVEVAKNRYSMMEVDLGIKESGFIEVVNSEIIGNKPIVIDGAYALLMKLKNVEEE